MADSERKAIKTKEAGEIPIIFSEGFDTGAVYTKKQELYKNALLWGVLCTSTSGAATWPDDFIQIGWLAEKSQITDLDGNTYKAQYATTSGGQLRVVVTLAATGETITRSVNVGSRILGGEIWSALFYFSLPRTAYITSDIAIGTDVTYIAGSTTANIFWGGANVKEGHYTKEYMTEFSTFITETPAQSPTRAMYNLVEGNKSITTYVIPQSSSIETWAPGSSVAPVSANISREYLNNSFGKYTPPSTLPDTDPYSKGGGGSTSGGGAGRYVHPNEKIAEQATPTINISESRFLTLYNPTSIQLRQFATYLWSTSTIDTWKKIIDNPMEAIIGLNMLPVPVASSEIGTIQLGNWATGVSCNIAAAQFVEFDCGSLSIEPYADNYLDYSPYTAISIYLPYIGLRQLPTNAVMGKTVQVKYKVDIFSGACVAFIIVGGGVLLQYSGACAMSIPVTSQSAGNVFGGVINTASNIAAATPGILSSIGTAGGAIGSAFSGLMPSMAGVGLGVKALSGIIHGLSGGADLSAAFMSGANDAANTSSAIMQGAANSISIGGSAAGNAGFLGSQNAYLIIESPNICAPQSQNTFTGYPSYITATLGDLKGYTEVSEVIVENINATQAELSAIESALRTGVFINEL